MHWRRKRQPTPVFLPGESQGRGAWWAAVYGVAESRTRLKRLSRSSSSSGSDSKKPACNAENPGSILGSGRSPGEGNGYPWIHTPEFLPGEFHGQQSLMGYSPWGRKESDMTERLTLQRKS